MFSPSHLLCTHIVTNYYVSIMCAFFVHSCFHGFETGPTERVKCHKYISFQKKWSWICEVRGEIFVSIFRPFILTAIISFSWLIAVSVLGRSWWCLHKLRTHVTCRLIRAFTWACPCQMQFLSCEGHLFVYLCILCTFLVSRPIVKVDIFFCRTCMF